MSLTRTNRNKSKTNQNTYHMERNQKAKSSAFLGRSNDDLWSDFYYLPLAGWTMAFQNYKPQLGILHSEFVGLQKFQMLFSDVTFLRVIRNTLAMGVINLVATFVTAIVFAILLNEIKSNGGKRQYRRSLICHIFFPGSS